MADCPHQLTCTGHVAFYGMKLQEQASQQHDAMAQLAEYQKEYAAELDAIKLQHQQALSTDQQQTLVQLQEQQSRHEALLAERDSALQRHLERFHAMHAEAMTDGQMQRAEQLFKLKDDHAKALADLTRHDAAKVCPLSTMDTIAALSKCLNLQPLFGSICSPHRCRITRPYKDAQNRLLWRDKTCPART